MYQACSIGALVTYGIKQGMWASGEWRVPGVNNTTLNVYLVHRVKERYRKSLIEREQKSCDAQLLNRMHRALGHPVSNAYPGLPRIG